MSMAMLEWLRDAFATVDGVRTSKIGFESTMTPASYPIVRVVPGRISVPQFARGMSPLNGIREIDSLVYFGLPIGEEVEGGLEELYREQLAMEQALLAAIPTQGPYSARWVETFLDEDRIDAYKLMAMRLVVVGQG